MNPLAPLVTLFLACSIAQSKPAATAPLGVGDAAPALHISAWMPSEPPARPGPQPEGRDTVVVMHFWSAADEASRPNLALLSQLHAEAGPRAVIIGLSNEEPEVVAAVSRQWKLPYWTASDDDNQTTEAWLTGTDAFPWTFVVDRNGRIVWRGDSMWEMREVVHEMIAGRYDLAAARRRAEADTKAEEAEQMCLSLPRDNPKAIVRAADKVIAADPQRVAGYLFKKNLLSRLPDGQAKLPALFEAMRAGLWNRPSGLKALLAWQWDEAALRYRDPALMLRCAERLVELTKGSDPFALADLARVQHELGRHDGAVESQARAAELIKFDPGGEYEIRLEYYRRIKSASASAAASAPASAAEGARSGG